MGDELEQALAALRAGLVVGMPTDTVYGLAADPRVRGAVAALAALKGRPANKAIPVLAESRRSLEAVARFDEAARDLGDRHWPGPLTLVLPLAPGAPADAGDPAAGTVAVRVPDHPVALALLARAGPTAVTSANRSGEAEVRDAAAARALFGPAVAVYLEGTAPGGEVSTVLDLTGGRPRVLRPGPIRWPPP